MSVRVSGQAGMGRKPFQEATVRHAIARLTDPTGSRRFLVADEVGLGKTLVAQGVVQTLSAPGRARPLNVFYVCSSLTIANQNKNSLLEVLPEELRKAASVEVDRPTLLPWTEPSLDIPFTLFTLTPGTLPLAGSARGRVDERAALWCLVHAGLPEAGAILHDIEVRLKLVKDETWQRAVEARSTETMRKRMLQLSPSFVQELRSLLHLPDATQSAIGRALLSELNTDAFSTIQGLRQRLGRLGLGMLRPDVVILDEFQRFFEILDPFSVRTDAGAGTIESDADDDKDEDAHGLLRLLMTGRVGEDSPAILMLSATPYRPPAGGIDGSGLLHCPQFFRLLEFLYGAEALAVVPNLRTKFRQYGIALREDQPGSSQVIALRDELQSCLSKVIARTERAGLLGADGQGGTPGREHVELQAADVKVFRHLWQSASDEDRGAVSAYWSSIPYPLQMMDQGYKLQERAVPTPGAVDMVLEGENLRRYKQVPVPHPRLRALRGEIPGLMTGLPWLPPTLPWWPLGEPFKVAAESAGPAGLSKVLLFSRFRAVPRAIASSISYEAERKVFSSSSRGKSYDYLARRRGGRDDAAPDLGLEALPSASFNWQARQRESGEADLDHGLLSLFITAPRLSEIGNPQQISGFASGRLLRGDAIESVAASVRAALESAVPGLRVVAGAKSGNAWRALVRLEKKAPTWPAFERALNEWVRTAKNRNASAVVASWLREGQGAIPVTFADVEELAELAIVGPGMVLYRASQRVFGAFSDIEVRIARSLDIALGALRSYLDEPEFHLTLDVRQDGRPNHPANVRRAVWNGNLEAVLDEYFSVHAGLGATSIDPGRERKALDALEQALAIRVSSVRVQGLNGAEAFRLRCHVAMPFGLTLDKDERREDGPEARPDALRHAFNSPFRPFVLATTSIGQEGLDFHVYCDRLVHWDLPASPVDLEQRDGRINRFGGLAVRKALARRHQSSLGGVVNVGSPWGALANSQTESCEGMAPWWGTEGAQIHRTVFLPPLSRQGDELTRLLAGLSHYRLALGQSDPEQLLQALHRRVAGAGSDEERRRLEEWLRSVRINLAPVAK